MYKNDRFHWRNRIRRERGQPPVGVSEAIEETSVTTECFEYVPRKEAPECLTLFLNDGQTYWANYTSLEYGFLKAERMKLVFRDELALIDGENLNRIQWALTTRRITFLRAAPNAEKKDCWPFIKTIELIPSS